MPFSYKNMIEGQGSIISKKVTKEYETKLTFRKGMVYLYVVKGLNPI